ncbi:MAG: hypothetical protein ACO1OG_02060 [Devosia sp.]
MQYKASFVEALGETQVELVSNAYSDAWPMLRRLTFRKMPIDLGSQCLPLATAILTRNYCGDVFEFEGIRIGTDYADAIRALLSPQANVINVDGFNRSFATAEVDVMVNRAGKSADQPQHTGTAPLARVDWNGDFVDPQTRSSANFAFGAVQTNAMYFADPFSVSVAVGLLFGRDKTGRLIVSPPAADKKQLETIRDALRIVGITLEATIAQQQPQFAKAS